MLHYFSDENLSWQNGTSATISIKSWFFLHLLSLLSLIPFVGVIVWLVVYIMLGLRSETAPSIANYIKFQLIACVVAIAFFFILLFGLSSLFASLV